ncbi:MAG: hypothetical protein CFE30_18100 [Bradyrhizobium sp. PARBB1]|nr:MAG: hypothetical protein CFE30_18100 [Bradyrhizobium sp. PARBB1]PSO22573.1 hypothetical protein C7G43_26175 [Bradyrhizobium sp. MOS004]HAQ80100.1 hypothetical protein [Bradyrhizobium sp.]HAR17698.1 hypothetical protein [Bradyrhizobium sp.]HAR27520.1 hypothetical protein [Bradyrhizobium sp.]
MALNREWHRDHRMPPRATREQRIRWHVAHANVCACRPVPDSVRLEVEKLLVSRRRPVSPTTKNQGRDEKPRKQPHAK